MYAWFVMLRSEILNDMCAKLHTAAASNNRDHVSQSLLLLLARSTHTYFCSSRTSRSWWITQSMQHHRRGCNNIPSILQRTAPIARSLCEGWTRHNLHILVTAPFCCNRKSRAACAKSFAPRQQATVETMHRNLLLLLARSTHTYFCSSRTSCSWWITQSTQHRRRGCNCTHCTHIFSYT